MQWSRNTSWISARLESSFAFADRPIALGFQIEALVEYRVALFREQSGEHALLDHHQLHFSNFQFSFADVVRPGEPFHVEIRKTVNRIGESGQLANRIAEAG